MSNAKAKDTSAKKVTKTQNNKANDTKVNEVKEKRSIDVNGFIRKLSSGLMIPIALLPIAGLFLGVGAGFENVINQAYKNALDAGTVTQHQVDQYAYVFTIFKMIGDLIFGNLPVLFCLGVALAFSDDVGVAVFTGVIAWIVFNATQSAFIWDYGNMIIEDKVSNTTYLLADSSGKVLEGMRGSMELDHNLTYQIIDSGDKEIVHILSATSDDAGNWTWWIDGDIEFKGDFTMDVTSYTVGPYIDGMVPESVIASNIGIKSMQTSVFGGILMGFWAAFMYNKFYEFEMPKVLGFFSGTRFVPIITFLTVPLWGIFFVLLWPMIGIGLDAFGGLLLSIPFGFDAFLFGTVERSLIPFGLHHAFYSPLWYTSAGGALYEVSGVEGAYTLGTMLAGGDQNVWFEMQNQNIPFSALQNGVFDWDITGAGSGWIVESDALSLNGTTYDVLNYNHSERIFAITSGMNPGQYQQGKFPFMLFGLPAAGAAMIMAAKKENRELAMSVIGASALTSFLTGITEPIEFTFLFLAPILYYGFHIWMAGLSFFLLDLLGSHVGMTFSGGIFDYMLFGVLPDATGLGSNCLWVPIVGILYVPIYYFFFIFMINKMDIKTPGRDDSGEVVMKTKADYRESKGKGASSDAKSAKAGKADKDEEFQKRLEILLESLGGIDNLTNVNSCATKLRLQVKDPSVIDFDRIKKETGAFGFSGMKGKSPMIVYGADAQKFKTQINKLK